MPFPTSTYEIIPTDFASNVLATTAGFFGNIAPLVYAVVGVLVALTIATIIINALRK